MENKKRFYKTWWFLLLILLLIVIIYPKECGTKPASKDMKYSCYGAPGPNLDKLGKPKNTTTIWCLGLCSAKSIKKPVIEKNDTKPQGPDFLTGFGDSFGKLVIPLVLIFIIIGVIQWIQSMQSGKKTEVRIIKGPKQ